MSGSVMRVVCRALSGRTVLFGAFVPGALPQATLYQSFGLKNVTASGNCRLPTRNTALPKLCCVSPSG